MLVMLTSLYAKNPDAYAALGDQIYNNVDKIQNLSTIGDYSLFKNDIDRYVGEVKKAKQEGLKIKKSSSAEDKRAYLNKLRKLAKDNDYYVRSVQNSFKDAIEDNNTTIFIKLVNSGLIDTNKHKHEILKYYTAHRDDIHESGIIKIFLDEEKILKEKAEARRRREMSKKRREQEKIKRLRQKDKLRQERLEQKLDEAVEKKKSQILQEQKEELIKSI
jgi:hypothetical protein